jgi:hypothetical protein
LLFETYAQLQHAKPLIDSNLTSIKLGFELVFTRYKKPAGFFKAADFSYLENRSTKF